MRRCWPWTAARARPSACSWPGRRCTSAGRLLRRRPVERIILRGRLVGRTETPEPRSILPYRRCLIANVYRVEKVLAGTYSRAKILVGHWAILDGKVLPARWKTGASYRLIVEPMAAHRQLETERFVMDSDELELAPYYDVRRVPAGVIENTASKLAR